MFLASLGSQLISLRSRQSGTAEDKMRNAVAPPRRSTPPLGLIGREICGFWMKWPLHVTDHMEKPGSRNNSVPSIT